MELALLLGLLGLALMVLGFWAGMEFGALVERTAHQTAATEALRGELEALKEQLAKRRHPYPTANGLEDALAVAIDTILQEEAQSEYRRARLEQVRRIVGEVRVDPLGYDSERPADRPNKRTPRAA